MRVPEVAKLGALGPLAASKPGVRQGGNDRELAAARAEIARLSDALKEIGVRLLLAEGKSAGTECDPLPPASSGSATATELHARNSQEPGPTTLRPATTPHRRSRRRRAAARACS